LRLQYEQAKLQKSVKQVKQKDVQGYEFYMEHLVDEAGEMAVKGNCDSIVTKLMQQEQSKQGIIMAKQTAEKKVNENVKVVKIRKKKVQLDLKVE
jgi:hypothetical protein